MGNSLDARSNEDLISIDPKFKQKFIKKKVVGKLYRQALHQSNITNKKK